MYNQQRKSNDLSSRHWDLLVAGAALKDGDLETREAYEQKVGEFNSQVGAWLDSFIPKDLHESNDKDRSDRALRS